MRLSLLTLVLCLASATASAQLTWDNLSFGQSRDSVHTQLDNQPLAVSSTPDNNLQTNTDYPILIPGLLYPIPMMVTFRFDTSSRLAETGPRSAPKKSSSTSPPTNSPSPSPANTAHPSSAPPPATPNPPPPPAPSSGTATVRSSSSSEPPALVTSTSATSR